MNINNNFTPIPWHLNNIQLQSHRATYAFGHIVPLYADKSTLLPFQIITQPGQVSPSDATIHLRRPDGSLAVETNLWPLMAPIILSDSDRDIIIYNATPISPSLPIGQYYLTLASGGSTWYSDIITIMPDTKHLTEISWWCDTNMKFRDGVIVYQHTDNNTPISYRNRMYFAEEIGMPEYTVEEEGETRNGLFYASKIISGKKYMLTVAQCSEAMCDSMRFIHLADHVVVRDGYNRSYQCDSILVTPQWISGGVVASASIEITTDTFVKSVGSGYTIASQQYSSIIGESIVGDTAIITE